MIDFAQAKYLALTYSLLFCASCTNSPRISASNPACGSGKQKDPISGACVSSSSAGTFDPMSDSSTQGIDTGSTGGTVSSNGIQSGGVTSGSTSASTQANTTSSTSSLANTLGSILNQLASGSGTATTGTTSPSASSTGSTPSSSTGTTASAGGADASTGGSPSGSGKTSGGNTSSGSSGSGKIVGSTGKATAAGQTKKDDQETSQSQASTAATSQTTTPGPKPTSPTNPAQSQTQDQPPTNTSASSDGRITTYDSSGKITKVEEKLPDGTIRTTTPTSMTVEKPDGSTTVLVPTNSSDPLGAGQAFEIKNVDGKTQTTVTNYDNGKTSPAYTQTVDPSTNTSSIRKPDGTEERTWVEAESGKVVTGTYKDGKLVGDISEHTIGEDENPHALTSAAGTLDPERRTIGNKDVTTGQEVRPAEQLVEQQKSEQEKPNQSDVKSAEKACIGGTCSILAFRLGLTDSNCNESSDSNDNQAYTDWKSMIAEPNEQMTSSSSAVNEISGPDPGSETITGSGFPTEIESGSGGESGPNGSGGGGGESSGGEESGGSGGVDDSTLALWKYFKQEPVGGHR